MRTAFLCVVLFTIFCCIQDGYSQALKSSEVLTEAQSAYIRGDLFSANRFYTLVYEKTPQALDVKDIENFLITKEHLYPKNELIKYCKENSESGPLKTEIRFYCAKVLTHSESFLEASQFIEKIPKSYQKLEYHFLKATLLLKLSKSNLCLDEIDAGEKKITENTSSHFKDLIKVIYARCLLAQGRYEEAVSKFQSLSVGSDFYVTTLEEQVWAHFKNRDLISAKEIVKIILSYFSSQSMQNQIFGADMYFRIKYLQAYMELISQNREKSKDQFLALSEEIKKFKKQHFSDKNFNLNVPKDLVAKLENLNSHSQLLKKDYEFLKKYKEFTATWLPLGPAKKFDKELRVLIAINNEAARAKTMRDANLGFYRKKIEKLKKMQITFIAATFTNYFIESRRTLDSLEFKSNMGQVENYWADRTEGKRTLAEVLDSYKEQSSYLEDYIGK